MGIGYASEKFNQARRNLMLPHPSGETESIVHAFHECSLGLHDLSQEDREHLEEYARDKLAKLESLMDTTGIEDVGGRGTWAIKAERFTIDEKYEISDCIDTLTYVFNELEVESR